MKVLVTGGTGFTGKALVKRLIDEGHSVIVLDNKEHYKTHEIKEWGAKLVLGSVTDRKIVDKCMVDVDVVQHLAAAFREMDVPHEYYDEVNVEGTRTVIDSAYQHKVKKFVYASTCGVHGNVEQIPADEDSPINPADYYQRTKYEAEPIVNEYSMLGMKTVILRGTATYGGGDPGRFLMIYKKVAKGAFPMFGDGKTLYHPVYIDNLIDAHILAMEENKGDGGTYLIADEDHVEIEELVREIGKALNVDLKIPHFPVTPLLAAGHVCEWICKPFGIAPPIFPRRVDWFRQNRSFSIEKAKKELGYKPSIRLNEGLRNTAEWYKKEGFI